ncbi:MAG: ribonuclease H-like domain-containing protein [Actinomycetota bacterium]
MGQPRSSPREHRWPRSVETSWHGLRALQHSVRSPGGETARAGRHDDPGGRQSEVWFEHVLAGDEEMKGRLLAYNEDDVIAQHEIRRWIRSHDDGTGPGSTIPSVHDWPQ